MKMHFESVWNLPVCKTVTMMTNSVANNGNPFGATDYDMFKQKVLDTGVQILEYDQGVSYHGKCFVIGEEMIYSCVKAERIVRHGSLCFGFMKKYGTSGKKMLNCKKVKRGS